MTTKVPDAIWMHGDDFGVARMWEHACGRQECVKYLRSTPLTENAGMLLEAAKVALVGIKAWIAKQEDLHPESVDGWRCEKMLEDAIKAAGGSV